MTTQTTEQVKRKKFYKIGEMILVKASKEKAIIRELDKESLSVVVEFKNKKFARLHFWEVTKLPKRNFKGLDHTYNEVRKFHKAFNHPVGHVPTFMDTERAKARAAWICEEIQEFLDAPTVVDQADAMIDAIYFCIGTLVELGVKPESLFEIVQHANMSKLWEDGKPRYKEDGKIMKPPGWQAPEDKIAQEIERQLTAKNRG